MAVVAPLLACIAVLCLAGASSASYRGGSSLASIAQGAAEAADAAAASQREAAGQAALQTQTRLAQEAAAAAAALNAVLAGKQTLLAEVQQQERDAHAQVESEQLQEEQARRAAAAASRGASLAHKSQQALAEALEVAQLNVQVAEAASRDASSELAAQQEMVASARQRHGRLQQQLQSVLADVRSAQAEAQRAGVAAQAEQDKVDVHAGLH